MSKPLNAAAALVLGACPGLAASDEPLAAAPAGFERLELSADGTLLSGNGGTGGGVAAGWLHYFGAGAALGAGAERQHLANASWNLGSLSGFTAFGSAAHKQHVLAEVHQGAGDIGSHAFHYSMMVAGLAGTLTPRLGYLLEERRIDIDTSHGNLPKFGLTLRVTPRLQATASYAHSAGGNLGTRLTSLRFDYAGNRHRGLVGVVRGPAAPVVFDLARHEVLPGDSLTDAYAGFGFTAGRTAWLLVADYQEVAGSIRSTVTLNCSFTIGDPGHAP
jgi:hypothetical protein